MITDPSAVGQLIAFGLRPRQTPTRDADYAALVARWHTDASFAAEVAAVAAAQGLRILECSRIHGLVVSAADEKSPYAMRVDDYFKPATSDLRLLHGFVHLVIALAAYPTARDLEIEDRVPMVVAEDVAALISRLVARIRDESGNADAVADEPLLEPFYKVVARAPDAKKGADDRSNPRTYVGAVRKALGVLVEQGLADAMPERRDTWRMRTRYRLHVLDAAATAGDALELLRGMAVAGSPEP